MRKIIGVALLVTALTCSAYAGDMQNPITENPPPSAPASSPTAAPGEMPNGSTDTSSSQPATTSVIQGAEVTLGVIQGVLALI